MQVSSDFEADVKGLPLDTNSTDLYMDFISTYGTHYTSKIVMGAKAVIQSQVWSRASLTQVSIFKLSVCQCAEVKYS